MVYKPRRRQRYEGMTVDQTAQQLSDDLDEIDAVMQEHIAEDEVAFASMTKAFEEWKLDQLRTSNRTMLLVIIALVAVVAGIVTPLITK